MQSRSRPLLVLVALAALLALPAAAGAATKAALRVTTTCPEQEVLVRFGGGDVRPIVHRFPGRTERRIDAAADNVFAIVRLGASWARVKGGVGTRLELTADGPRLERWRWRFRIRSADPERDTSNYIACIRPLLRPGVSFLDRMRRNPGVWTFRVHVRSGVARGARAIARTTIPKA